MPPTHYETLGIPRDATPDAIRAAFRRLAMEHHPDRNPQDPVGAGERFKALNTAYQVLSDPVKRQEYDAELGDEDAQEARRHAEEQQRRERERRRAERRRHEQDQQRVETLRHAQEQWEYWDAEALRHAKAAEHARAERAFWEGEIERVGAGPGPGAQPNGNRARRQSEAEVPHASKWSDNTVAAVFVGVGILGFIGVLVIIGRMVASAIG